MTGRPQISQLAPAAYHHLLELARSVGRAAADAGLDARLVELVKIRASLLNGCAFCLDMHAHAARGLGESEQRILLLGAWREAGIYTEQERAALALTDALTGLTAGEVPDDVHDEALRVFTPEQFGAVAWTATAINAFNRLGVLGRMRPPIRPPLVSSNH